ncbi:hypothetical protein KGF56_004085 [Candida oxycetoniae]|uniref:tRNA(Ile)-lysidine synthetase n=1 Tax=Candida oxycetoniae TaxID=497107 RepID=A0AAI9WWA8_9ASCO|nr:uncharacterized protein KGF56_004085 [Candida oxycetoniae]KAI3403025.2 hypothetical protein KGF56_004085 [Candida oxycetoniae]
MTIKKEVFKEVLGNLFGSFSNVPRRVGIGLSGGPDSMLLTWLLKSLNDKLVKEQQFEIHAMTVDHNYRKESSKEVGDLAEIMSRWGIKHSVRKLYYGDIDPRHITNFEEVARAKRFDALNSICNEYDIPVIFLGHHNDDQVETFVQRLQGNSSIFGLAGTRAISSLPMNRDLSPLELLKYKRVNLVRPLLNFTKDDITNSCRDFAVPYFTDPTNSNTSLTRRNYLRSLFGKKLPQLLKDFKENGFSQNDEFFYTTIMKQSLSASHRECTKLVELFEAKAHALHKNLLEDNKLVKDDSLAKLTIEMPKRCFTSANTLVTSRFLYQILYPYCTLNHYHWAYAKLERQVVPKIASIAKTNASGTSKVTMMNLIFQVTNNASASTINLEITRAPLSRRELEETKLSLCLGQEWSDWVLFDKRFWLCFQSEKYLGCEIEILPYKHKEMSKKVNEKLYNSGSIRIGVHLDTLPVVLLDSSIVAFPTIGLGVEDIAMRWSLKANKFNYKPTIDTIDYHYRAKRDSGERLDE